MNTIFFTQSHSLDMFYHLALSMQKEGHINKVGFYVTDLIHYERFVQHYPEIEKYEIVKEWEIVERSKKTLPNINKINAYEEQYGDPTLWGSAVADRRIYFGRKAPYTQDYKSRYSHERILAHVQCELEAVLSLFETVQPDLVVNFICVTSGEYLGYLIANKKGIPFFNLRPTRIKNYFYAADSIYEPPVRFVEKYKNSLNEKSDVYEEARLFIRQFQTQETLYEGVFTEAEKKKRIINVAAIIKKIVSLVKLVCCEWQFRFGKYRHDNHIKGFIGPVIHRVIIKPWRIISERIFNGSKYVKEEDLKGLRYVFYPLHKEPEATLLVYNKYMLNQIEVVRNIAQSIPIGMKLLVKEHPASIGYRKSSFCTALRDIPNVEIVSPKLKVRTLIEYSELVTVLGGTVGFEALLLKKPVVLLGSALYQMINSKMMRKVSNSDSLAKAIDEILCTYKYEEDTLITYISFIIENSVGVDFYSKLLKRSDAYSDETQSQFADHIDELSKYILDKYCAINGAAHVVAGGTE